MASDHIRNIGPMQAAAKCEKIKKNGERCRGQACRGRKLCRSHGGKAGAPRGNQNALKHGAYTRKSRERFSRARTLVKTATALLKEIGPLPHEVKIEEKPSKNRILVEQSPQLWRQHQGGDGAGLQRRSMTLWEASHEPQQQPVYRAERG